ncbi:MAG: type II secretion system protein [Candidatus Omnitrophota bacterium]
MKSNNIRFRYSFTLIELLVVIALVGFVIISVSGLSMFFIRKVNVNKERYNLWSQISYTFDDMRIRCISAVDIVTPISAGGSYNLKKDGAFIFYAEDDIYNITPNDLTDNSWYRYLIDNNNNLSLDKGVYSQSTGFTETNRDIVIDGKYNPNLIFRHNTGDEPNFVVVTIDAEASVGGKDLEIERKEGLRFWFVDLVQ